MLAAGKADYAKGALFEASSSLYSSATLALQYVHQQNPIRFWIKQPLRAESGQGILHYAHGRSLDGTQLYQKHSFSLVPNARAIHFGLRHDRAIGAGKIAVELLHVSNRGHISGHQYSQISAAYWLDW